MQSVGVSAIYCDMNVSIFVSVLIGPYMNTSTLPCTKSLGWVGSLFPSHA